MDITNIKHAIIGICWGEKENRKNLSKSKNILFFRIQFTIIWGQLLNTENTL